MAAVSATSVVSASSLRPSSLCNQNARTFGVKMVCVVGSKSNLPSLRSSRLNICCAAKPETVAKVCDVVKKQLALSDDITLTPESKFSALGADSLDTVEIVMGLEEEFGITVEEDGSQNIATVLDAAEMIDKLVQQKPEAA